MSLFVFFVLFVLIVMSSSLEWRLIESTHEDTISGHLQRDVSGFFRRDRAALDRQISLTFAVTQNNIDDIALSIADPKSSNYGKHLSRDEIKELTGIKQCVMVPCVVGR